MRAATSSPARAQGEQVQKQNTGSFVRHGGLRMTMQEQRQRPCPSAAAGMTNKCTRKPRSLDYARDDKQKSKRRVLRFRCAHPGLKPRASTNSRFLPTFGMTQMQKQNT